MRLRHLAILSLIALTATADARPPSPRAVDAVLAKVYGPYRGKSDGAPDWERPVWSAEMKQLFDAWQEHIGDNLTGLNDYGWFCECQDWDQKRFAWKREAMKELASNRLEVTVRVDPGWERMLVQRLIMVQENGRWVIDDLISEAEPDGLKASLRREISEPVEE